MKKLFFTFSIVCTLMAFSSCSKTYTCECVTSYTGGSTTIAPTTTTTTITDTKSKAEETCNSGDQTTTNVGITAKTDCNIK